MWDEVGWQKEDQKIYILSCGFIGAFFLPSLLWKNFSLSPFKLSKELINKCFAQNFCHRIRVYSGFISHRIISTDATPKKFHVLCVVQTSKQGRWENVWKFSLSSPQWASLKFINFLKKKPATFTQATLYSIFSF